VVIHFGRLGDTILVGSLLQTLHARYGEPCTLIGAAPWCAEVFLHHDAVTRVCGVARHAPFPWSANWWRAIHLLRQARNSPVYVAETEPRRLRRVRALLALAGVERSRCLFLSAETGVDGHWVDRWARFGQQTPPAGGRFVPSPDKVHSPAPLLRLSSDERRLRDDWLHENGWQGRDIVLVQPGNRLIMRRARVQAAAHDSKAWPAERWAALIGRVRARIPDAVVLLCGAKQESGYLSTIRAASTSTGASTSAGTGGVVPITPPLRRLFALCEVAHSMISVDSGPAHAAAALGVPLVVLFGSHEARQWLPRGPDGTAVIGLGGPPRYQRADQIGVDAVFQAWTTLSRREEPRVP
jgi:heptosyltransferase-2/heptosyltransferase-3